MGVQARTWSSFQVVFSFPNKFKGWQFFYGKWVGMGVTL
jgi:hypothetical protein